MAPATNGLLLTLAPHDELDTTARFIVATTACNDNESDRMAIAYRTWLKQLGLRFGAVWEDSSTDEIPSLGMGQGFY